MLGKAKKKGKRRASSRPCPKGKRRVGKKCMSAAGRYLSKWCKNGPVLQSGPQRGRCPSTAAAARRARRIGRKAPKAAPRPTAAQVRAAERAADMALLKRTGMRGIRARRAR